MKHFKVGFFVLMTLALNPYEALAQGVEHFAHEVRGKDTFERKVMSPLQAVEYSKDRIVLLAGSEIRNLRGLEEFLVENGYPAEIVYPSNEPGPLQVRPDQFAVLVNEKYGGIYTQYSASTGIGADILIFARNSGLKPALILQ